MKSIKKKLLSIVFAGFVLSSCTIKASDKPGFFSNLLSSFKTDTELKQAVYAAAGIGGFLLSIKNLVEKYKPIIFKIDSYDTNKFYSQRDKEGNFLYEKIIDEPADVNQPSSSERSLVPYNTNTYTVTPNEIQKLFCKQSTAEPTFQQEIFKAYKDRNKSFNLRDYRYVSLSETSYKINICHDPRRGREGYFKNYNKNKTMPIKEKKFEDFNKKIETLTEKIKNNKLPNQIIAKKPLRSYIVPACVGIGSGFVAYRYRKPLMKRFVKPLYSQARSLLTNAFSNYGSKEVSCI